MLFLDSPLEVGGLTVYADHATPGTFHYMLGSPRLVDGGGVSLQVYRGEESGGLLTLDVDLAVDESVLAAVREELARRSGGRVDLVPVLFDSGTARLTALGVSAETPEAPGRLVETVLSTAVPSLLGQGRAVFALGLDAEGAVAMSESLRSGILPVVVAYELTYRGLRPASGLTAELDYRMSYDHLRVRAAADTLWFRADVSAETEALEREGHVRVTDVDYLGGDPMILAQRREAAVDLLQELVTTVFFRPATSPSALDPAVVATGGLDPSWAARGRPKAAFTLRALAQEETQRFVYDRSEVSAEQVVVSPQGMLSLPPGFDAEAVIREVDLDRDGPLAVSVAATAEADWTAVRAIQVDVRSGAEVRTVVLTPDSAGQSVVLPAGAAQFRVQAFADRQPGDLGEPPQPADGFQPLTTTTLVLEPAVLAGRRRLTVTLGTLAPDLLVAAECRLRPAESPESDPISWVLRPDHPTEVLTVWGAQVLALEAEVTTTAGAVLVGLTVPSGESVVVVNLPRDRFPQVLVTLSDPLHRYTSVDVTLEGVVGGPRHLVTLGAQTSSAWWTRVRQPEDPGAVRYRVSLLRSDGVIVPQDWSDHVGALLIVGDLDLRVDRVTVALAGWTGLVAALLTLTSLDPPDGVPATAEVLLQGDVLQTTVRLPVRRHAPLHYRLDGQLFTADGDPVTVSREETAEVVILTPGS